MSHTHSQGSIWPQGFFGTTSFTRLHSYAPSVRVHWRVKGESRNRARLHQEGLRSIPDIPWDPATEGGGLGLKRLGLLQVRRGPQRPVAARGAVRDRTSDQIERTTPQSQRVGRIGRAAGRRKNWCSRRAGAVGEPGAAKDEERRQGQVSRREQRKPRSSEQRAGGSARHARKFKLP